MQAHPFSRALKKAEDFLKKEDGAENSLVAKYLGWFFYQDMVLVCKNIETLIVHGYRLKARNLRSQPPGQTSWHFNERALLLHGSAVTLQDILWLIKEDKRTEPQVQTTEELCHTFQLHQKTLGHFRETQLSTTGSWGQGFLSSLFQNVRQRN